MQEWLFKTMTGTIWVARSDRAGGSSDVWLVVWAERGNFNKAVWAERVTQQNSKAKQG